MKAQEFKNLYESVGPRGASEKVCSWLREGKLDAASIDLRECFIAACGEQAYAKLGARYAQKPRIGQPFALTKYEASSPGEYEAVESRHSWTDDPSKYVGLQEAGETGADLSAFSAITGQLAFNMIGKGWTDAKFIGDQLYTNYPTPFSGEKIPWLSNVFANAGGISGDQDIHPLMPYPEGAIGPRYVTTPRVFKGGLILSFSLEFLLFDRTGQAQASATMAKVGESVRYGKEYMQLRLFMNYNPIGGLTTNTTGANQYSLNGTLYQPYQTSGSNYVNAQGSTPLVDYTSINNSLYLRSRILDPDTGRPIILGPPTDLFVMPFQVMNARRILTATNYQTVYPGYSVASPAAPGNVKLDSGNPVDWNINLLTSPIALQILLGGGSGGAAAGVDPAGNSGTVTSTKANAYWMMGNFKEALYWADVLPFRTEQAAPGNIRQFEQDIQTRVKCSYIGVPLWYDPRFVNFFYNT